MMQKKRICALFAACMLLLACMSPAAAAEQPSATAAPSLSIGPGLAATLNQRMSTRSGPSTGYTEELGTHPIDTEITIFQQEMGNHVPWVMVEFEYRGGLFRAYTGMKRIDTDATVPWAVEEPVAATMVETLVPRYGPGERYAPQGFALHSGMAVEVYGDEDGYALIDFHIPVDNGRMRGWVPLSAISGYMNPDG